MGCAGGGPACGAALEIGALVAKSEIEVRAPREVVFEVLTDAASYRIWVVGSKRIRGVDANWPNPGSRFHHIVGWGPIENKDTTKVLELEPDRRILLEARLWPLGTATVEVVLEDCPKGTHVTLIEELRDGPARFLEGPPLQASLWARNMIGLRRLRDWSEQRYRSTPGVIPED